MFVNRHGCCSNVIYANLHNLRHLYGYCSKDGSVRSAQSKWMFHNGSVGSALYTIRTCTCCSKNSSIGSAHAIKMKQTRQFLKLPVVS